MFNRIESGLSRRIKEEEEMAQSIYRRSLEEVLEEVGSPLSLSSSIGFVSYEKETDLSLPPRLGKFVHSRWCQIKEEFESIQSAHLGFHFATLDLRAKSGRIIQQEFDLMRPLGLYMDPNGIAVVPSALIDLADVARSISGRIK